MTYNFLTSSGVIAAELVNTRLEAIKRCHENSAPHAFFERGMNAFRVFKPISKQGDTQHMHDYCASVQLPANKKFQLISSLV